MKLRCAACGNDLNIPDHLGGKTIKCPICGGKFNVPGEFKSSAAPPRRASDELVLSPIGKAPETQAPAGQDFCPGCGAKWHAGDTSCRKCSYNLALGKRLNAAAHRRRVSIPIDFTKVFLVVLAGGAIYGCYWLYHNWSRVERDVKDAYDNASRAPVTTESQTLLERNKKAAQQPAPSADPPARGGGALPADPEFLKLPVDERVKAALADLKLSETFERGRSRAVELARVPEAVPELARALEASLKDGAREPFEYRMALATALAAGRVPGLAGTFAACLTVKGMTPAQADRLIDLAASALKGMGDAAQPAVEAAFKAGGDEARIGILTACERNEWKFAAAFLKPMLESGSVPARRAALEALAGRLKTPEQLPAAVQALQDADATVAMAASRALLAQHKEAAPLLAARLDAAPADGLTGLLLLARPVLAAGDAAAAGKLAVRVRALKAPSPAGLAAIEQLVQARSDRERAALALHHATGRSIQPAQAEPYVAVLLGDPFVLVRRRAALALAGVTGEDTAAALAFACLDEDLQTAMLAADAPGPGAELGRAKKIWLAGLGTSGHRAVCCAGALQRAGAAEGAPLLRRVAGDETAAPAERALALRFLGAALSREEQALAVRLKTAHSSDPLVVRLAESALARAGDEQGRRALLATLRSSEPDAQRELALLEAAALGEAALVPVLFEVLKSGNAGALAPQLCLVLGRFPSAAVLESLLGVFSIANDLTMDGLALAVGRYGEQAVPKLQPLLVHESARVRGTALAALAYTGLKPQLLAVAEKLKTEKDAVAQKAAGRALAHVTGLAADLAPGAWAEKLATWPGGQ